jgi:hypothetical protein
MSLLYLQQALLVFRTQPREHVLGLVCVILIDVAVIEAHFLGECYSSVHDVVVGMMDFLIISRITVSDCIVYYCSSQYAYDQES